MQVKSQLWYNLEMTQKLGTQMSEFCIDELTLKVNKRNIFLSQVGKSTPR